MIQSNLEFRSVANEELVMSHFILLHFFLLFCLANFRKLHVQSTCPLGKCFREMLTELLQLPNSPRLPETSRCYSQLVWILALRQRSHNLFSIFSVGLATTTPSCVQHPGLSSFGSRCPNVTVMIGWRQKAISRTVSTPGLSILQSW